MDILRKACGVGNDILQPSRSCYSCAESVLFFTSVLFIQLVPTAV